MGTRYRTYEICRVSDLKDVLITGGTGFIGRHLVDFIEPRGYRVTVLTRAPQAQPSSPNARNIKYVTHLEQLDPDRRWYG